MKRSEMIKLLGDKIMVPEVILRLIEKAGMLPPGYMKPIPFCSDGKQYPLIPGDFQNESGIWCTPGVNEWEPEEEKA